MPYKKIHGCMPDTSGDVWGEPASILNTNTPFGDFIWIFEDSGNADDLFFSFGIPEDFKSNAFLRVIWTSSATSGDVDLDFLYRAVGGSDLESLDQSTAQRTISQTNLSAPSATRERMTTDFSMTDADLAADDTVKCALRRLSNNDTMAAKLQVHEIRFYWDE